jgi:hypothetical protein
MKNESTSKAPPSGLAQAGAAPILVNANAGLVRKMLRKMQNLPALPFLFGRASIARVFLAYQPDSQVYFDMHPDYAPLFTKFTALIKKNAGDSGTPVELRPEHQAGTRRRPRR